MFYENKRRNRVYGEPDPVQSADNGMKGMTENESESRFCSSDHVDNLQQGADTCCCTSDIHFRYVL